nr:uncharacterized protein LOC106685950 isoform X2 [Halyomorpha halys]
MDTFHNKMEMSLDEIILQEQKKKGILRTSSNSLENIDDDMLQESPMVSMNSTKFIPENPKFIPRRVPGLSQHQWLQYRNMTKFGHRRNGHITRRCPGIPLLKLKRGFRQGVFGNNNYKVKVWRQPNVPYFPAARNYGGNTYPLTRNYLQQFDKQNHVPIAKRGPGSVGSRGSLCSRCSKTSSVRSHTSYRSVPSNRSGRSFRSNSSNSRKSMVPNTYRLSAHV